MFQNIEYNEFLIRPELLAQINERKVTSMTSEVIKVRNLLVCTTIFQTPYQCYCERHIIPSPWHPLHQLATGPPETHQEYVGS